MELVKEKTKWGKDILMMVLFLTIIFSFSLSQIAGNVLFVKRIGSEFLPYIYISDAILSTITIFYIASNIRRIKVTNIIKYTALITILGVTLIYLLIDREYVFSYILFLVFTQMMIPTMSSLLIWNLALKVCTPFEAKRSFGLYSLGGSLGGIIAGLTSSLVSETLGTEILIPIVILSLCAFLMIIIVVEKNYNSALEVSEADKEAAKTKSYWQLYKEGNATYKKNKLAKYLSLTLTLFYVTAWIADFEFQKILGDNFTEEKFTLINGYVSIIENLILIIFFLFIQHRILRKLGTIKTLGFSPAVILLAFILLFFFPIASIVILLRVTMKTVDLSTFSNSIRLVFTAIPNKIRSSVTTFINSNAQSAGTFIAGVGLVVLTNFIENVWIILVGITLLITMIALVFYIKNEYIKQLARNLDSEDIKDLYGSIENLAEPSYKTIGVHELMRLLNKRELQPETIRKIVFALGKIDNVDVIPNLLDIFKTQDITVKYSIIEAIHSFTHLKDRLDKLPFTRLNIVETYKNIFLKEEDPDIKIFILQHIRDFDPENVIQFLKEAIHSENANVQYQGINAMRYFNDRGTIRYIKPFLTNEIVMTQASAIIALWQFSELRPDLLKRFITLMQKTDKDSLLAIFSIISKLKFTWEYKFAESKLDDPDEEIRAMAALALTEIDRYTGLNIFIKHLITKSPFSKTIAQSIKELSPKMKERVLKTIKNLTEASVEACIQNLRDTYLNFTEEIEFLRGKEEKIEKF